MNATLNARRDRAAAAWDLRDEVVLIAAGEPSWLTPSTCG
jgi:hypothetical protein